MPAEAAVSLSSCSLVPPADGVPMSRPLRSSAEFSGSLLAETKRMVVVLLTVPTASRSAFLAPLACITSRSPIRVSSALPARTVWMAGGDSLGRLEADLQPVLLEVSARVGHQVGGEG